MSTASHLIEWKTNAWKDPAMVSWYSQRMVVNQGTNRLKNRLEVDACLAYATGEEVLDVGIGTGRGSLPLLARGQRVTGIDSSQAMLDECQRLASQAGLGLHTQTSQLDCLPFTAGSFDSLISLNVLMHFPHWRQILPEWKRVVRPGGRLVFDVHSLDHYRAALGRPVAEEELLQTEAATYTLRIAAEDLLAEADRHGLAIHALVPYGAFLGGGNRNYLLGALEDKAFWARLLSFMATDEALFAFALFIEQELVARLTTTVTGRFMVVLENRADRAGNQAWLAANRRLEAALRQTPIELEVVAARLGSSLAALRERAGGYLAHSLRSVRLLECLAGPLVAKGRLGWSDLLAAPAAAQLAELATRRAEDRLASELARRLPHEPDAVAQLLDLQGVPLGTGLEYLLVERLLTRGLGRFTGVRS